MEYTYMCKCGCNIEFYPYSIGWDMHFMLGKEVINYIFYENKIKIKSIDKNASIDTSIYESWSTYIDIDNFETWGELWDYICKYKDNKDNKDKNNNNTDNNTDNVMLHLFNIYNPNCFNVPMEAKLLLDYIN